MSTQYRCSSHERIHLVRDHATLNGIDYLEVLDHEAPAGSPRQRTLLVHLLKPAPGLARENVAIDGGVRITPVKVLWAFPASAVPVANTASNEERDFFAAISNGDAVLVVRTDGYGDFSRYRLRLVAGSGASAPPTDFDPVLSQVDFSFKVECPTDFDCRTTTTCPPEKREEPLIDYMAKDYASLRRLMLDRMAVTMPQWTETNPSDLGITLVELLAYVGDHLSYFQDAVATEAYLATARRRVSVRRHAKMLDYPMHDGANARAWACFDVDTPALLLLAGTRLLTGEELDRVRVLPGELSTVLESRPTVFETMRDVVLRSAHTSISFHTWSDTECCLPKGATRATLRDDPAGSLVLAAGDVLLFEEILGATTGLAGDADPEHRQAVVLTRADAAIDPLDGSAIVEVEWDAADALAFTLCISANIPDEDGEKRVVEIGVARGNVVAADHGLTIENDPLIPESAPASGTYRPHVASGPMTFAAPLDMTSATTAMQWKPGDAVPAVSLDNSDGTRWDRRADLLASDAFDTDFVVETENDGIAHIRFGDGVLGSEPTDGIYTATYRIGTGRDGNLGAGALRRVVTADDGIVRVWNPMPATGGTDPESLQQVRLYAPEAFRTQERAVTEGDYAAILARLPDVARGTATMRWTGSWHTVYATVDRRNGLPVDADYRETLVRHLDGYRIAGIDLDVGEPTLVSLDIAMNVCVETGHFRASVRRSLLEAFSSRRLPSGELGFFHPDNFSFGQPLYLSAIYERAMRVAGVDNVEVTLFQRWGRTANGEIEKGMIEAARLEILRLDNDPSFPENGRLQLTMRGGL